MNIDCYVNYKLEVQQTRLHCNRQGYDMLDFQQFCLNFLGGGSLGCNTLYSLAKLGVKNAVLLEKDRLTAGNWTCNL